jgi:hypothetical protein
MDEKEARNRIGRLASRNSAREAKYIRSYNRYVNNGERRESIWDVDTIPISYVTQAVASNGIQTQINIIRSIIDTIVSKISQANVRPYFLPVNGLWDTIRLCREIQNKFDIWLDEQHAYPKAVQAFRNATIFDYGVVYVNPESDSLTLVKPWEYYLDPDAYNSGTIPECGYRQKHFPLAGLKDKIDNPNIKAMLDDDPFQTMEYTQYWDLYNGQKYEFAGQYLLHDVEKLDYEQYGGLYRRPFVEIYYSKPIRGFWSDSLTDNLYPIQKQIDEIVMRLDVAYRNSIQKLIFVASNPGGVKASMIGNGVEIYGVPPTEVGKMVEVVMPAPVDKGWVDGLEFYINKAYEIAGISQLSAQSKAPANLDSGKALDTMEDIESDRFNTQLQQFTHYLVDIARVKIDCSPKGMEIIKDKKTKTKITWGDARKIKNEYKLQFSAASSLSKNPEEKRNEIEFLKANGILMQEDIPSLYDMPDLDRAHSKSTAAYDHCQKIIYRAVEDDDIDYDESVNINMLFRESIEMKNQLCASDENDEYINRLDKLIEKIYEDMTTVGKSLQPPAPPPPAPVIPPISQSAFDSGQVSGLINVAEAVKSGTLSKEQAAAIITGAYPKIDPAIVSNIITIQSAVPGIPVTKQINPVAQPQGVGGPNA